MSNQPNNPNQPNPGTLTNLTTTLVLVEPKRDMFDKEEVELSDRRQVALTQLHTIRPLLTQL